MRLADHALANRGWDPQERRFVSRGELEARVAAADFVLLGETHDNPAHHELQAALLRHVVAAGRRPALVLEPLDRERQAAVDAAVAKGASAARIGEAAQVSRGWDWPLYAPIVAVALSNRIPIIAGNLSREEARAVARDGFARLAPGDASRLRLEEAWNDERARTLRRELVAGHCGDDSPRIDAMAPMQRARDAVLADRILGGGPGGAVAILGRGHARADIGVPLYLRLRAPQREVLSVGFVEVQEGRDDPADYEEAAPDRHDVVWFTPRAERPDPCAGFHGAPKGAKPE